MPNTHFVQENSWATAKQKSTIARLAMALHDSYAYEEGTMSMAQAGKLIHELSGKLRSKRSASKHTTPRSR